MLRKWVTTAVPVGLVSRMVANPVTCLQHRITHQISPIVLLVIAPKAPALFAIKSSGPVRHCYVVLTDSADYTLVDGHLVDTPDFVFLNIHGC